MSKSIPTIRDYMTASPLTIGRDQTLAQAHLMMRTHGIRHLPVLEAGKLEGILSDRDLGLVETLRDVDQNKITVEEAMTPILYTVPPETPLDEVALQMAEHKYGSALVVEHGKVVGVFTAVDGLRALSDVLHGKSHRKS